MGDSYWIAQAIIVCLSIISWIIEGKALIQLNKALKIQRQNLKVLEVRRLSQAYKFLDNKYNRLCVDTLGKSKLKIDLLEVILVILILINTVLMHLVPNNIGISLLVFGVIIIVALHLISNKGVEGLSDAKKMELKILRVRIKYNKYIKDLSDNDKRILEKEFENVSKSFKNEKNKELEFKNTLNKLKELESKLDRFLKLETVD